MSTQATAGWVGWVTSLTAAPQDAPTATSESATPGLLRRIVALDVLRGIAILGTLAANIGMFAANQAPGPAWHRPIDTAIGLLTAFETYIVPIEKRIAMGHVINNDPRPHYIHQGNLTEDRIIYPVLDAMLTDYHRTFADSAPLRNLRMSQTGRLMLWMQRWTQGASDDIRAQISGNKLTLTNTGSESVRVPVTVPAGSAFGSAYAGTRSGWVKVAAGRTVTIRVTR